MHDATRLLSALVLLSAAACSGDDPQQSAANNLHGADIEALPADESAATSSEELINGVNEPGVDELGNQH